MGVFSRFKDIMSANINSLLDKAENPEKMIRLMIQEMEDTLVELKSACAARMAAKTKAERQGKETDQYIKRWQLRAELAVEKKKDDLAREALIEKMKYLKDFEVVQADVQQYEKLISECKNNIIKIEEKLQVVRQKHKLLIQRGIHASEQIKAKETIREAAGSKAFQRFSELEGRIERMEAEAEMAGFSAPGGLEDEFHKLESVADVEAELQELKDSIKKDKK
ncbi:MAG: PspA/IM30 family protein [Bacteroidetes bacterium]|nr:PspA/IM30 family protein [Bacteroidota bacterium]